MLTRLTFIGVQESPSPVLFVRVNDKTFDDGRIGYDLSKIPTDRQILDRINRWWALGAHIKRWLRSPAHSPGLLVGVAGSPGLQIVIGAVYINKTACLSASRWCFFSDTYCWP